jgi:hypothetical protein
MASPKSSKKQIVIAFLAGLALVAAGFAFMLVRVSQDAGSPQTAVARLKAASDARDARGVEQAVDVPAVVKDLMLQTVAAAMGKEPSDPAVIAAAKAQDASGQIGPLTDTLKKVAATPGDRGVMAGTFLDSLFNVGRGTVVVDDRTRAHVQFSDGHQLLLAKEASGWRVVGFRGFDKDMEKFRGIAQQTVKDTTLGTSKTGGDGQAPAQKPSK